MLNALGCIFELLLAPSLAFFGGINGFFHEGNGGNKTFSFGYLNRLNSIECLLKPSSPFWGKNLFMEGSEYWEANMSPSLSSVIFNPY